MTGQPMGPAFSTPYHDRIKATQATPSPVPLSPRQHRQQTLSPPNDDSTEALKDYLFGVNQRTNANKLTPNGATLPRPPHFGPSVSSPARMEYKLDAHDMHGYPDGQGNGHGHGHGGNRHIQAMENDLRRILKLDQGMGSSPVERRLFSE
jgi:hypothetical protein